MDTWWFAHHHQKPRNCKKIVYVQVEATKYSLNLQNSSHWVKNNFFSRVLWSQGSDSLPSLNHDWPVLSHLYVCQALYLHLSSAGVHPQLSYALLLALSLSLPGFQVLTADPFSMILYMIPCHIICSMRSTNPTPLQEDSCFMSC